ncbi:MAG: acyltransferase [Gemmataceae bacterium]
MKQLVKYALHGLCIGLVSPMLLIYWLSSLLIGKNRALEGASQSLATLPGIPGVYLRRAFLSCILKRCSPSAEVHFGTLFSQADAMIDDNAYVGPRCQLGLVHIEKNVLIAAGVHIPSGAQTHAFDDPDVPIKDQGGTRTLVTIGEGAWIGSAAVVMADVGKGSIIAAGSVVTKPVPDNVIAGGVPAKVIRNRFEGERPT